MKLTETERKIIEMWQEGKRLNTIIAKGYSAKMVKSILDKYTKENAKQWLK